MRKLTVNCMCFFAVITAFAGENDTKFHVDVQMVQLRATVTDSLGQPVRNLNKNDFQIFENGVAQQVTTVIEPQIEAAPATVFILFDTSNRMYRDFSMAEDCVADFIRNLAPADSVAVYSFTRNVSRLSPPGKDRSAAIAGLRNAVVGDATALYDSLLLTLRDAAQVNGSKVIVVFSNGPDNASMLSAGNVRAVAEDEGIPIYVLSTQDPGLKPNPALSSLTASTGGKAYFAPGWQKQKLAFEAIGDDLRSSYLITYYSDNTDQSYRSIDVRISGDRAHGYRVRARRGYHPASVFNIKRASLK